MLGNINAFNTWNLLGLKNTHLLDFDFFFKRKFLYHCQMLLIEESYFLSYIVNCSFFKVQKKHVERNLRFKVFPC